MVGNVPFHLKFALKYHVINVRSIEYFTTEIELMFPVFKYWTVHKILQYLT